MLASVGFGPKATNWSGWLVGHCSRIQPYTTKTAWPNAHIKYASVECGVYYRSLLRLLVVGLGFKADSCDPRDAGDGLVGSSCSWLLMRLAACSHAV